MAMAMDKALKDKWVKALRSGRYKQTKRYLQNSQGNCCLGVLCRITRIEKIDSDSRMIDFRFAGSTFNGTPNPALQKHWGISEIQTAELMSMNDGTSMHIDKPKTFSEIADWIEKNIKVRKAA